MFAGAVTVVTLVTACRDCDVTSLLVLMLPGDCRQLRRRQQLARVHRRRHRQQPRLRLAALQVSAPTHDVTARRRMTSPRGGA